MDRIGLDDFRGRECACVRHNLQGPVHLIHSEGFRECCDLVIDFDSNIRHPDRDFNERFTRQALIKLAPAISKGTTIYLKACHLNFFFNEILPILKNPVIIVSGDSDVETVSKHHYFLNSDKLFHWFTQNCGLPGHLPKVTRIPIGIDNPIFTKLSKRIGFLLLNLKRFQPFHSTLINELGNQLNLCKVGDSILPTVDKPLKVLCTFHQFERLAKPNFYEKGREPRLEAYLSLRNNPNCFFPKQRLSQLSCWQIHQHFSFEVSPHGKGLDCHRTWESLFLKTIPIVKSSSLDELYTLEEFPVVIVENWQEITLDNLKKWHRELSDRFDRTLVRKLSIDYWQEKIQLKKQQCLQAP